MSQRNRAWADRVFTALLTAGTGSIFNLLTNAPTVDTLTAVRIVGNLQFGISPQTELETQQVVDVGIGVASSEAVTIGAAALPDPTTESEYPPRGWLYVDRTSVLQTIPSTGGVWKRDGALKFDIRSMRKIDKGTLFMFVEQNDLDGSSSAVRMIGRVRVLCLT